jgi:hypothetical protein
MAIAAGIMARLWFQKSLRHRFPVLVGHCLLVLLFSLPGLFPAVADLRAGEPLTTDDLRLLVLERTPHHLDPYQFLDWRTAVLFFLYAALLYFPLFQGFDRSISITLSAFIGVLIGLALLAIMARYTDSLWFLVLYPFRVSDVMVPLFFAMFAPRVVWCLAQRDQLAQLARSLPAFALSILTLLVMAYRFAEVDMPMQPVRSAKLMASEWSQVGAEPSADYFAEAAEWIKTNTPEDAIFVAPPWEYRFWLLAQRAEIVCTRLIPANSALISDWYDRHRRLLGDPPPMHGTVIFDKGREHYNSLSQSDLRYCQNTYGASYYLTYQRRDDLGLPLVYSNEKRFIYELLSSPSNEILTSQADRCSDELTSRD